jgi:nicotinate dehydrogenase subunit A
VAAAAIWAALKAPPQPEWLPHKNDIVKITMPTYKFRVNDGPVTVDSWDPDQPLLYVLRNSLGLHAAKFGCGLGQCGACTVLLDGKAVRSCQTPVRQVAGHAVTTLEVLGTPEKPHAIQAAFIAEQAAQCGYCTNGMILATKALLDRTPHPTAEQIKADLAGNLCRCGTHTRILSAVLRAAKV